MTDHEETDPLAGVPQEVLDAARDALAEAGPIDNVYVHIGHGDVGRVAREVLSAALGVWREQASGPVTGAPWQPEPTQPDPLGHDYHFAMTNAQVEKQAHEGHGWVRERLDGRRAKCGGTALVCGVCRRERELVDAGLVGAHNGPDN